MDAKLEIEKRREKIESIKLNAIKEKEKRLNENKYFKSSNIIQITLLSAFLTIIATILIFFILNKRADAYFALLIFLMFLCFVGVFSHIENKRIENYFQPNTLIQIDLINGEKTDVVDIKNIAQLSIEREENLLVNYYKLRDLINSPSKRCKRYSPYTLDLNKKKFFYEHKSEAIIYTKKEVNKILGLKKEIDIIEISLNNDKSLH